MSDFGLSENTYSKTYFRQDNDKNVLLPMKWIAPESFNFGIFSEKTDVVRNYIATNIVYVIRNKKTIINVVNCSGHLE